MRLRIRVSVWAYEVSWFQGLGFRVWGSGFGFRISGLGFKGFKRFMFLGDAV